MESIVFLLNRIWGYGFGYQCGNLPIAGFWEKEGTLIECSHKDFGAEITMVSGENSRLDSVIVLIGIEQVPAAIRRMVELGNLRVVRIYANFGDPYSHEVLNFTQGGGRVTEKCIQAAQRGLEQRVYKF